MLSVWHESGDSLSRFASRHGLVAWRLMRWRRLLGKQATIQFHPVKLVRPPSRERATVTGGVELVLRDGRRVVIRRDFDAALLEDVVRAVESWSC